MDRTVAISPCLLTCFGILRAGVLALLLSLAGHATAGAQNGPATAPNLPGSGGSGGGNNRITAPGDPIEATSAEGAQAGLPDGGSIQGSGEAMIRDPRIPMNPSGLETGQGGFTALTAHSNEGAPSVFQDPESGVAGIMNEGAWRRMSTNLLSSPLSLMHITWQLTDPGVAQGFANAFQQSVGVNELSYASQNALMQQYALGGNQGYTQAVSMVNCQRQNVLEQQQRNETENWQKARMECLGAYDISQPTGTGSAPPVEEAATDGSTYALNQDPAHNVVDCAEMLRLYENPPPEPSRRVMSFIDTRMSGIREEPSRGPEYVEKFRKNWGDLLYGYQQAPGPDMPTRGSLLVTCVVPPKPQMWEQARDSELEHWRGMMTLLEERCKAGAKQQSAENEYTPFDPMNRNSIYELAENLTAPFNFGKFTLKASTIDVIYNLFIVKEIRELTEESCHNRLSPDVARNDLNRLKARQERTRYEHRAVHALVVWITQGKMLANAENAISELTKLASAYTSSGDASAAILPAFFQLISGGVNVSDYRTIPVLAEENFQMITRYIEVMQQQASMDTGSGVDLLRSPFDKTGSSPGGYGEP